MSKVTIGLRLAGALAMAFMVAHCGDSNVHVTTGPGIAPSPGTFTGTLSDGGSIQLKVGSIEAVEFDCDNETIQETFDPPKQVDNDGTFDVGFSDAGRKFRVQGTFRDNNNVDGTINDEDNRCDVTFDAVRGNVVPTPVRTPTGNVPTSTPVAGETSTPVTGETSTPGSGETATPGGGVTATPSPGTSSSGGTLTPTPTGSPQCPVAGEVESTAGTQKVLDTGWTGLAHNQTVIQDGKLTFTVSCNSTTKPCGTCNVGGPIQNLKADQGDINAHRCANDTSIKCSGDPDCGTGKCQFFFGAPLPLSAGGVSTCVTNQISGAVTGTANVESGAFHSTLNLTSRVYNGIETALPCPVCNGDATVNDGQKGGTCSGGPRNGQPCDGNGRSPIPSFGTTSFDCPPNPGALITALSIALDGSSGTETRTLGASSPVCSAAPSKKCFCPSDGQVTQPNACIDDTGVPGDGTLCQADSGSANEGHCTEGPIDTHCQIETFRGCLVPADCPASGDSCISEARPCYLDNGTGSVTAVGHPDPPDASGIANPTFAALFCVGKTNAAVNAAAGLPGLGRIELPLQTKELFSLPSQ